MRALGVVGIGAALLVATGLTSPHVVLADPAALPPAATLITVECPAEAQPSGVECAELTVPLDWQTPDDGRTTTIAVRVKRATGGDGLGFTFNPGGPGSSGIDAGPRVYDLLPPSMSERFDFVMWDPRGVGLSGPTLRGCAPTPGLRLPDTGPVDWDVVWTAYAEERGRFNRACFDANPDSAPYLGTWQVMRDLEALRAALGYDAWTYWGMSYGTRIAYTYAMTFPGSLRATVVDGSLWPQESIFRIAAQQTAAWVTGQQVYASIVGRAQGRKLTQILTALDDTVVTLDGMRYNRWMVAAITYGSLGSQELYPRVRALINGLHDALFATPAARDLRATARLFESLETESASDAAPDYANTFIHCADLHDRPSPQAAAQLAATAAATYGTALGFTTGLSVTCMGLPADYSPAVPRGLHTITLPTPPVVVLSTGDPRTPWLWGRTMANQYARSRTISYESSQHVTYLRTPSACVNDPVTEYLLTKRLPPARTFCPYVASAEGQPRS
jgi:pimeloyl-ACP methyl ester carboxylesterase